LRFEQTDDDVLKNKHKNEAVEMLSDVSSAKELQLLLENKKSAFERNQTHGMRNQEHQLSELEKERDLEIKSMNTQRRKDIRKASKMAARNLRKTAKG